jgi:hypothetical protein
VGNSRKNSSKIRHSYQPYDRIMPNYTSRGFPGDFPDNNDPYNFEYFNFDRQNRYGRSKRLKRYDRQNRHEYDTELRPSKSIRRFKLSDIQIYDGTNNVHLFIYRITSIINRYEINEVLQILFLYFENNVRT